MAVLKNLLREPLLHCLLAGAAIFILYEQVASDGADLEGDVIVVGRDALLTHLQYVSPDAPGKDSWKSVFVPEMQSAP